MPRTLPPPPVLLFLALSAPGAVGACHQSGEDTGASAAWPEGCEATSTGDARGLVSLEVNRSEAAPTVVELTWTTAEPATTEVHYGETLDYGQVLAAGDEATTQHRALLKGLPVDSEQHLMLVIDTGQALYCTADRVVEIPSPPSTLPVITASDHDPDRAAPGYFVLPLIMMEANWPVILDAEGRLVWYYAAEDNHSYRALLTEDRDAVLYMTDAETPEDEGILHRVSFDGSEHLEIPVAGCHRDFVEIAPGRYATLTWEIRSFEHEGETRQLLGDRLVEVTEEGETELVWAAFDSLDPDLDVDWPQIYEPDPEVEDWLHVNGLFYDAESDIYYLSASNLESIFKIDGTTGELLWKLGGADSDFTTEEPDALIHGPHSIDVLDGSLLVFNRGDVIVDEDAEELGPYSEVDEIALDEDAMTAETTWTWGESRQFYNNFLGDAIRLPEGNTLVDWSSYGQLDQVTPAGEVVLTVNTDLGGAFGFIQHVDDLY